MEAPMRRLALVLLLLPLSATAQEQSTPRGSDCETPTCAAGTLYDPGSKTCEPVSS